MSWLVMGWRNKHSSCCLSAHVSGACESGEHAPRFAGHRVDGGGPPHRSDNSNTWESHRPSRYRFLTLTEAHQGSQTTGGAGRTKRKLMRSSTSGADPHPRLLYTGHSTVHTGVHAEIILELWAMFLKICAESVSAVKPECGMAAGNQSRKNRQGRAKEGRDAGYTALG